MRTILFTDKLTGQQEIYTSLKPLFDANKKTKKWQHSIRSYLSRKKIPYENEVIKVERKEVHG